MKVILLKKIANLGNSGEIVRVKSGFARNFLIPYKKALLANKKNLDFFSRKKEDLIIQEKKLIQNSRKKINLISKFSNIIIFSRIKKDNKIFGSIGKKEILQYLKNLYKSDFIEKKEIILNNPIKKLGIHKVKFQFYKNFQYDIIICVLPKKY
ncbi:50S ribosomal protein L9 [bacterium endosymbiont of Pedicinus badii]|uniref:50S ribosomal protein L9 n=1 Tax=bacterium endosymbiont of Pedicinus badii TaxID=1719126 RepID=UPI0009BB508B|nr:50S ribosomal protein L9 [bacterium endosymbiont of Pedicinus badii]OQM34181.1 hypothetical protein AOQ89_02490 [bacterium endosymbiont of Pedicinus badii]